MSGALAMHQAPKCVCHSVTFILHGTFAVEGAQLVEEEEYEEVVKEKRELPPVTDDEVTVSEDTSNGNGNGNGNSNSNGNGNGNGDAEMTPASGENETDKATLGKDSADDAAKEGTNTNGDQVAEKCTEEKPDAPVEKKNIAEKRYEWVDVKKTKRRTKRTDLKVTSSGRPGLSDDMLQRLMDAETAMQAEMREIIETDEKKNDLEAYIFSLRDKCSESGEYSAFLAAGDRENFMSELTKAEDWLWDTPDATKTMYIDKVEELKKIGDAAAWRCKEHSMRDEWIQAVAGTVVNYRAAGECPAENFGHIAAEKLATIVAACNELQKWLDEMKEKQAALAKHEKPVLLCADMERKSQDLARMADDILREPKPSEDKKEDESQENQKDESPQENEKNEATQNEDSGKQETSPESHEEKEAPVKNGNDDMEVD